MTNTPPVELDPGANYEAAEVALWLRISWRTFQRRRRKLLAEGFPAPVSRWGRKVWSGEALLAWRNRPQETLPVSANVLPIHEALAARARLVAAGGRRRHPLDHP